MTPKEQALQMLREMQRTKTCSIWPSCSCSKTLRRWIYNLNDEERVWPMDVLECAESLIFISLECVSHHCPDEVVRAYAVEQLQNKWWDKQKAMSIHVEP
jgi:hypothetical protein